MPNPNVILNKTFAAKVDVFEALGLGDPPNSPAIVEKLRHINKMRNSLAHNLERELSKTDINILIKGYPIKKNIPDAQKLKMGFFQFIGFLHALIALNHFLPFAFLFIRNEEIFKRDLGWNKWIMAMYPMQKALNLLQALKMK